MSATAWSSNSRAVTALPRDSLGSVTRNTDSRKRAVSSAVAASARAAASARLARTSPKAVPPTAATRASSSAAANPITIR